MPLLIKLDFYVIYHARIKNHATDVISRLFTTSKDESFVEHELRLLALNQVVGAKISDAPAQGNDHRVVNINNAKANVV